MIWSHLLCLKTLRKGLSTTKKKNIDLGGFILSFKLYHIFSLRFNFFRFEQIFDQETVQDDIFKVVAEPVIDK